MIFISRRPPFLRGEEEIAAIRQEMAVMGSNDFEFGAIDAILTDLHEGKISLQEAKSLARQIRDSKQDYH